MFRPVMAVPPLATYNEVVYETKYHLGDIARMNEMLDVRDENNRRINEYLNRKDK